MRSNQLSAASIAALACIPAGLSMTAAAEPIVVGIEWTAWIDNIQQELDPRLPPVSLINEYDGEAGGLDLTYPWVTQSDGEACAHTPPNHLSSISLDASPGSTDLGERYPYEDLVPGTTVDASFGDWGVASLYGCSDSLSGSPRIDWSPILAGSNDGCFESDRSYFGVIPRPVPFGVSYIPLRYRPVESDGPWTYGWVAFEIREITPDKFCPAYEAFGYIGVSFESEPGVPAIIGAGLCPADIAPDAVLDLADIQAFVAAFTAGEGAADFDENGVYDLADLQLFVEAFTTGCGGILTQ